MMKSYPVFLIGMETKKAVVIGGGKVAARKVEGLLAAGACVTVVSPQVVNEILTLVNRGEIKWLERVYTPGDLDASFLVVAATDDLEINLAIHQEATNQGCLVNVVDNPKLSNFIVPALVRRGDLVVAISTGGASPALARLLRVQMEKLIDPEYGPLIELLEETRPRLVESIRSPEARLEAVEELIEAGLLEVFKRDGREAAKAMIESVLSSEQ